MDFTEIRQTLERYRFKVSCFDTKEAAADYLDRQIDGKTIAIGGSVTSRELGLIRRLRTHNTIYTHWHIPEGMTEKEVLIKEMTTDVFIASANAIAMTGEIVNIDGRGNRITSLIYGHDKVYYIIGRNKIVPTLDDAVKRAKLYAAPLTAQRLGVNTPCAAEGNKCYDCNSPERICNTMTITWRPSMYLDVELLLIDEDLGY